MFAISGVVRQVFLFVRYARKRLARLLVGNASGLSAERYSYRSYDRSLDFDVGVAELRQRCPGRVFIGWPPITFASSENEALLEGLGALGIATGRLRITHEEHAVYLRQAEYARLYPSYYPGNLSEKALEHLVAMKLLRLNPSERFIDIAAENSPHAEVFSRLTGCDSYSQDIMFRRGVHGRRIGSDAAALPVVAGCFDAALFGCAIEHFEGRADTQAVKEALRVLSTNGRLVIVPLYLHERPFCATDPRSSVPGMVQFDDDIDIHCVPDWSNRHGRWYSPTSLYERLIAPHRQDARFAVYYVETFREVHELAYCRFALLAEKGAGESRDNAPSGG